MPCYTAGRARDPKHCSIYQQPSPSLILLLCLLVWSPPHTELNLLDRPRHAIHQDHKLKLTVISFVTQLSVVIKTSQYYGPTKNFETCFSEIDLYFILQVMIWIQKMTGGTPEVRSDKSLTFGPMDQWSNELIE